MCLCGVLDINLLALPVSVPNSSSVSSLADAVSVAGVGDHDPLSSMMTLGSMSYNLIFRLSDYRIGVNHPV